MLIKDLLLRQRNNPSVAITCNGQRKTYRQFYRDVTHVSSVLHVKKASDADNIGIFIPNSTEYALAYFSITFLGKVIVPIPIHSKKMEVVSTVDYCKLRTIITLRKFHDTLRTFVEGTAHNDIRIICLDELVGKKPRRIPAIPNPKVHETDTAILLHTSGTTSNPKKVMLSHRNLISNIESNIASLQLTVTDKTLIALPMPFGYCNTAQFLTHIYLGASITILHGIFAPHKLFQIVQDEKITNFTAVPSMLLMLLNPEHKNTSYDISSLKYVCFGGGIMPVAKLRKLIKAYPSIGFTHTYGQTEASPRLTCLLPKDSLKKLGSVGKPIPNVNLKIIASNGAEVKGQEAGEIIAAGRNIMKGYYNRPEETQKVIKDGWLHTGDLGRYDKDGYIYLVGRKKNIIISGGYNIYPEEIEELLMTHPCIKEVVVRGEPHAMLGEIPVAKIVLKDPKTEVSPKELVNYCLTHLSNHKVPKKYYFIDELEKTYNGKLKRA